MKSTIYFVRLVLVLVLVFATLPGFDPPSRIEGTGEFIDNNVIATKVKAEIYNLPALKSGGIKVKTFKGGVQLSGFVNSQQDIDTAVEVISGVADVKSTRNSMQLKGDSKPYS